MDAGRLHAAGGHRLRPADRRARVSGVLAWRRYSGDLAGGIVYGFALLLCLVSVPLHLSTFFTWSTEYLNGFPFWYSAVEVPMFAALSYTMTRLRFGTSSAAGGIR
jgi:hypothetical protein